METTTTARGRARTAARVGGPAGEAFLVLRAGFTAAPVLFGLDKFFDVMTDWARYLAPSIDKLVPGDAHQAMLAVGVVEIAAGLLVAVRPKLGAPVVAAWLVGIIVNLLLLGGHADVALRDFGLFLGAVALSRLAVAAEDGRLED